jgi:hypothetical protein
MTGNMLSSTGTLDEESSTHPVKGHFGVCSEVGLAVVGVTVVGDVDGVVEEEGALLGTGVGDREGTDDSSAQLPVAKLHKAPGWSFPPAGGTPPPVV